MSLINKPAFKSCQQLHGGSPVELSDEYPAHTFIMPLREGEPEVLGFDTETVRAKDLFSQGIYLRNNLICKYRQIIYDLIYCDTNV